MTFFYAPGSRFRTRIQKIPESGSETLRTTVLYVPTSWRDDNSNLYACCVSFIFNHFTLIISIFFLRHPIVKHFVSLNRKSVTAAWCQPVKKYPQYCQTFPCGTISLNRVPVAKQLHHVNYLYRVVP